MELVKRGGRYRYRGASVLFFVPVPAVLFQNYTRTTIFFLIFLTGTVASGIFVKVAVICIQVEKSLLSLTIHKSPFQQHFLKTGHMPCASSSSCGEYLSRDKLYSSREGRGFFLLQTQAAKVLGSGADAIAFSLHLVSSIKAIRSDIIPFHSRCLGRCKNSLY